jgi:hypothetical protein
VSSVRVRGNCSFVFISIFIEFAYRKIDYNENTRQQFGLNDSNDVFVLSSDDSDSHASLKRTQQKKSRSNSTPVSTIWCLE